VTLAYATPLVIWLVRPDRAQSLSKTCIRCSALISTAAAVLLFKTDTRRPR
jgi:hypothetical protein